MERITRFFKSKLSLQLLSKVVLVSSVLTLINISVQVYFDYQSEEKYLNKEISNILTSYAVPLQFAYEKSENTEIRFLLDELTKFESISHAQIRTIRVFDSASDTTNRSELDVAHQKSVEADHASPIKISAEGKNDIIDGEILAHSGQFTVDHIGVLKIFDVPILEANQNDGVKITLVAYSNFDVVKSKVLSNLMVITITQSLKAFIISFILLALFYHLVIKHIHEVSYWLRNFRPGNSYYPFEVSKIDKEKNELYELKGLVGELGQEVHSHTVYLEQRVSERTQQLAEANARLEQIAYTDSLTALPNRRAFFDNVETEIKRARRLSYNLGIALLDLDHFKQINDSYGHDAGDKVLVAVSDAMSRCLREQDCIGRIGGEEFAVILPGADEDGLRSLTNRLRNSVRALSFEFLGNHNITISIGFTVLGKNEELNTALKRADNYLYKAKQNGRDCSVTDFQQLRQIMSQ